MGPIIVSALQMRKQVQEGEHICQAHKWQNRFHPPNYTLNHQNCRPRACGLSCWVFKWKWGCLGGEPWRRRACHGRPAETGLPLPLSPQFRSALRTSGSAPTNFSVPWTFRANCGFCTSAHALPPTLHCTLRVLRAPAHPSKPSPNFPPLGRLPAAPSPRQNQSHNASVRTAFCTLRNLIFSRHVCARTHTHRPFLRGGKEMSLCF